MWLTDRQTDEQTNIFSTIWHFTRKCTRSTDSIDLGETSDNLDDFFAALGSGSIDDVKVRLSSKVRLKNTYNLRYNMYVCVWIYEVLRYLGSIFILTTTRVQTTYLALVQRPIPYIIAILNSRQPTDWLYDLCHS